MTSSFMSVLFLLAAIFATAVSAFVSTPKDCHCWHTSSRQADNRLFAMENDDNLSSSEWRVFDPKELGGGGTYGLGISAVVPRPIAVITSKSDAGIVNCAPFSYTGLLSHDPPIVAHGICMTSSGKKDTLKNIESSQQWVFNLLSDSWISQANACAEAVDYDTSEVEMAGLNTLPCELIQAPRLEEALVSMECELENTKEVFNDDGKHTTTIVFGRIVKYHVHKSVLKFAGDDENRPVIDLEQMRFVGRAGDITYWPAGEAKAFALKRP